MYSKFLISLVVVFTMIALEGCQPEKVVPKNIIVLIADGCGFFHIDAASIYQYGQTGMQVYEKFPVKYAVSTYSADADKYDPVQAWATFDWVLHRTTDSAAAATAIATGTKTNNGYLGVGTKGEVLETILERAEKLNKATGVVTSVPFFHATPAAFCVHDTSRDNYSGIINYMYYTSPADVIMGSGNPLYDDNGRLLSDTLSAYAEKKASWQKLHDGISGADADGDGDADKWNFIEARTDFQKFMDGKTPQRVLGLAEVRSTLQEGRSGDRTALPYQIPFIETIPTLAEISKAALNVLDEDPDGLFLMIEGGAVDWASHDNKTGRMIEEMIEFNKAVECVVEWVETNSNWDETLVIVTADHETGYLTGPGSGRQDSTAAKTTKLWQPLINNGTGNLPDLEWHTDDHSNSLVAFYAKGVGCDKFQIYADEKDPVRGQYIDNVEIGQVMLGLWVLGK